MNIKQYIENLSNGKADNLSVKKMKKIMKLLANPQDSLKYIHIAGTNGKGSVVEMLNNILVKSNLKVGKFISPHLSCYNERISINGNNIKDEEIEKIYIKIKPIIDQQNIQISFFEFFTIIAILYFYQQKVDIVVMETGLGGLYDSTNIINPIISVITSIGYDHMQVLGNTLEEITKQKAGIIKEKSSTVYIEQTKNIDDIIIKTCIEKKNILHLVKKKEIKNLKIIDGKEVFDYKKYRNIKINLKGKKQIQNASLAIECCEILNKNGYKITENNIKEGLNSVVHKARFEVICEKPTIIFDGGHNEQAIQNLKDTINMYYKDYKKIYVISILKTKDYRIILENIINDDDIYILTNGNDIKRYTDNKLMYEYAKKVNQKSNIMKLDLKEAIQYCKDQIEYVSFIIGSFYIYEDIKNMIK